MPNWCNNIILISGEESNMKPIYEFFTRSESLPDEDHWVMSTFIPEDEEFERIKESGDFLLSPYVTFYGCKWDFRVNECNGNYQPDIIVINPSTAWSPPVAFCQKLSEKFGVIVSVEYYESGNDMAGRFEFSDGEEIEAEEYSYREGMYHLDNETFWVEVESDLEWMACENPLATIDELIGTMYPFITNEKDIESLTEIYNEYKGE
jgi:hypothetical protein